MSKQFDDKFLANYLQEHSAYMSGRIGISKNFPNKVFWNATGNENRVDFPTYYFPKKWFKQINP